MKIVSSKSSVYFCLLAVCSFVLFGIACQRTETNSNANSNSNLTTNANTAPVNANANANTNPAAEIASIAAREPEKYRATVVLSAETEGGQKTIGIPTLSAEVARNGADRRVSFKLPDGSDLIYLEQGDKHIVIAPSRKQFAELTPESTGVQLQKLMTPGQLVSRLANLKGIERAGEESVNGRIADKYRYTRTTSTNTQAGNLNTEAFVYIDKDTGLPLRAELFTEASGSVQGVKGAKIVAEMRDVTTEIDPTAFTVPDGFSKVPPEQVRQQINALTNMAGALVKAMLSSSPQASPTATAAPGSSPSP
jgi:hypothetical protein